MKYYLVNKEAQYSGENEIHLRDECKRLPNYENQLNLGYFSHYNDAKKKASYFGYNNTDGCYWCLREHHTR